MTGRSLASGLLVAVATSAVGVAVNVATSLHTSAVAWSAVVVCTLVMGGVTAAVDNSRSISQQTQLSRGIGEERMLGVVLMIEEWNGPDGTHHRRSMAFTEEAARRLRESQGGEGPG